MITTPFRISILIFSQSHPQFYNKISNIPLHVQIIAKDMEICRFVILLFYSYKNNIFNFMPYV